MPSADDKVVLQVKLEIGDIQKGIKKAKKDVDKLGDTIASIAKTTIKLNKQQADSFKKTGAAAASAAAAISRAEKSKSDAIKQSNKELEKQQSLIAKIGSGFKSWGKDFRRGAGGQRIGSGTTGGHRWGQAAGTAGQLAAMGGRGARRVGGLAASVGSGMLGFMTGGMSQGVAAYQQYGMAQFGLVGGGGTRRQLSRAARAGVGMGYGPIQTAGQGAGVQRAVGNLGAVTTAQRLAQTGGGMGVGEATGIMGNLRQAGITFGGQTAGGMPQANRGPRELAKMIKAGIISGLERARLPEYLKAVSGFARTAGLRQAGRVDMGNINAGMGWLSQVPGWKGDRGAAAAGQWDQAIRSPGGGEAGQQLMYQSLGFGKPGGKTPFYNAMRQQQRGFFGKGGAESAVGLLGEITKQYGEVGAGGKGRSMQEANIVASQVTGFTIDQVEAMQEVANSGKDQKEKLRDIKKLIKKAEPIEKQHLKATKGGFSGIAKRLAGLQSTFIGIGADLYGPLAKLQNLQLDVMKKMMPAFGKMLEVMVGLLERLVNGIEDMISGFSGTALFTGFARSVTESKRQREERLQQSGNLADRPTKLAQRLMRSIGDPLSGKAAKQNVMDVASSYSKAATIARSRGEHHKAKMLFAKAQSTSSGWKTAENALAQATGGFGSARFQAVRNHPRVLKELQRIALDYRTTGRVLNPQLHDRLNNAIFAAEDDPRGINLPMGPPSPASTQAQNQLRAVGAVARGIGSGPQKAYVKGAEGGIAREQKKRSEAWKAQREIEKATGEGNRLPGEAPSITRRRKERFDRLNARAGAAEQKRLDRLETKSLGLKVRQAPPGGEAARPPRERDDITNRAPQSRNPL